MCGLELVSPSTFSQLLAYTLKDSGLLYYTLNSRSTQQTRLIDIMITTPACRIPPIPKQRRHICYYFSGPFTKFNIFPDRFVGFWRDKSSILFGLSSINYKFSSSYIRRQEIFRQRISLIVQRNNITPPK